MTDDPRSRTPRRTFGAAGLRNFSFKLPPRLVAQLDKIAESEGRSRNSHVRLMLTESVDVHREGQTKADRMHQARQKKAERERVQDQAAARA